MLMLIIQEHKLVDSLLRVTCKRIEQFVAFALSILFSIMLLIIFKVVANSTTDDEERAAR